jgi:hypothetical protein
MYPICVAGALNPRGHYIFGMGTGQLNALKSAFERMTDVDTAAEALSEAQIFCVKAGSFSHIAPRIKITVVRHRQEFPHIRRMLWLIVLAPLLTGLMMSLSLAHINITSQTFRVSRLPGGFMSELSPNFITCVTRTGKALLNGPTSHGRNTMPTFFKPNVLYSYPRMSIMQCIMRNQCSGR